MRGLRALAGLLAVAISPSFCVVSAQPIGPSQATGIASRRTHLSLDGVPAGFLSAIVQSQTAAGFEEKLTFQAAAMPPTFFSTWIAPAIQGLRPLKTVRLTTLDANNKVVSALDAVGVIPRQIEFPALDGAARLPLQFTISYAAPAVAATNVAAPPPNSRPPSQLLTSNFRFLITGMDTSRVGKIDAITITPRTPGAAPITDLRPPQASLPPGGKAVLADRKSSIQAGSAAVSNLVIYVSQAFVLPFQQWLGSSPTQTRSGSIVYLGPDMRMTWGTLSLSGLSITRITTEPSSGGNSLLRSKIEMTVGGAQLSVAP